MKGKKEWEIKKEKKQGTTRERERRSINEKENKQEEVVNEESSKIKSCDYRNEREKNRKLSEEQAKEQ